MMVRQGQKHYNKCINSKKEGNKKHKTDHGNTEIQLSTDHNFLRQDPVLPPKNHPWLQLSSFLNMLSAYC